MMGAPAVAPYVQKGGHLCHYQRPSSLRVRRASCLQHGARAPAWMPHVRCYAASVTACGWRECSLEHRRDRERQRWSPTSAVGTTVHLMTTDHWKGEVRKAFEAIVEHWKPETTREHRQELKRQLRMANDELEKDVAIAYRTFYPLEEIDVPELLPRVQNDLLGVFDELQKRTTSRGRPTRFCLAPGWFFLFAP